MRHFAWIFALAVAFVAMQTWKPTSNAEPALSYVDIMDLQIHADRATMPVQSIENPV